MTGELFMKKASVAWPGTASTTNGGDAYTAWGISLEGGALSTLMSPLPMKEDIRNESRLEHGVRHTDHNPKVTEREFAIPMHIVASSKSDYLTKYAAFRTFLESGWIDLWVADENIHSSPSTGDVVYHLKYRSCSQFRQFINGMAVFSVSFVEPNPSNRT